MTTPSRFVSRHIFQSMCAKWKLRAFVASSCCSSRRNTPAASDSVASPPVRAAMVHKARSTVSEGCHGERVRFGLFQPPGQGQGKGGACAREFLVSDAYAPRAHGDTHLRPAPHQAAIPSARHRAAARSGGAPAALSPQPWVPPAAASLPWRRRQPRACRGSAAGHLACTRLSDSGCFSRVLRGASEEGVQSTSLILVKRFMREIKEAEGRDLLPSR